jgi:hypothetical protein
MANTPSLCSDEPCRTATSMPPSILRTRPAPLSTFFENFTVPGSISDFGAARNAVVDTCYVIRTSWTDVNGKDRGLPSNQGSVGQIWPGNSIGPTFDGRRAIDVSAPAETIMTTYDPKSYWASSAFIGNEINDGKGLYGAAGANSSANPVTGASSR